MSAKKKTPKLPVKNLKTQAPEETQPENPTPTPAPAQSEPIPPTPIPTPEPPKPEKKPLTLVYLNEGLESLKQVVHDQSLLISQLQETLARKRKAPVTNSKVQIKDKLTGILYRSKNNAYQTLLKAGDLKALVDKGIFGDIPEKNTFGWYVLVREWPDRFEEVKPDESAKA